MSTTNNTDADHKTNAATAATTAAATTTTTDAVSSTQSTLSKLNLNNNTTTNDNTPSSEKKGKEDLLSSEVTLGNLRLSHRVIMAPLTRMRSSLPGCIPNDMNALYYGQRASEGGLIINEATHISRNGQGYFSDPGIFSDEQVEGWKKATEAVHKKKGYIYLQLWHVGRVSHSSYGAQAISASAVGLTSGHAYKADDCSSVPHEVPRAATKQDIAQIIEQYRVGTINAFKANFDGVEIHGANGYLINQFLEDNVNKRDDEYGGSIENRTRFLLEVLEAVISAAGDASKVGIRLSPWSSYSEMLDSNKTKLYSYVLSRLNEYKLSYVHLIGPDIQQIGELRKLRESSGFKGNLIVCGGMIKELANELLADGTIQAAVFGKLFIANPDLPYRLKHDLPLNVPDPTTFFGGKEKGYTDYPFYAEQTNKDVQK